MNNELYYNKYLFKQSGGRKIPISTYDQLGGKVDKVKSENVIDAAKNLAFTAADSVGTIASKFAQKGLKEGTEFVEKGLDQALGLDPSKTLKDQATDVALKIKEKGQLAVEVVKNPNFQEGLKDVAEASGKIIDTAVKEMQPVINTAIEKTGDTLEKNSEKMAQTAIKVGTGAVMAAADAVPGLGTALQVAITTGDVIKDGAKVVKDTSNTVGAITGEANTAAQNTISATKESQSKLTEASNRITKAIDEVTTMIKKGKSTVEKGASLNDLKKQATDSVGDKMKSMKATATKGLVDVGAEATGMKNTVRAARALGVSDENILKKSANLASKSVQAGGKTRKKRRRKNKTRNKKRKRNKSKKGKRTRKSFR
tara:strand:+ start:1185 stop:2294 length:1110 start_codon:yes stop_codon:yes gene_type:complete